MCTLRHVSSRLLIDLAWPSTIYVCHDRRAPHVPSWLDRDGFRKTDLICRYGGEEFCILMPDSDLGSAVKVAEQARAALAKAVGGKLKTKDPMEVTSSFGVSALSYGAKDVAELINQADKALYLAKQSGRNQVIGPGDES